VARARYTPHDVILGADSALGKLLGARVEVPAAHHQAPYHLGDGLTVAGWSPDGEVTEAVEVDGHRFGIGIHWHPEEGDDPRLLTALLEAAAAPRQARRRRAGRAARRRGPGAGRWQGGGGGAPAGTAGHAVRGTGRGDAEPAVVRK